tara:strand:+ start:547 stop:1017 length:471 start_codon:yes stop_codon:yes gene_type:complete
MYKPLPESVTIKDSAIHGLGLFAVDNIPIGTELGIIHVFAVGFHNNYIRTPLGGFINHSNTPNCEKTRSHEDSTLSYFILRPIRDIKEGEELTLYYTLYTLKTTFKVAKNGACPVVDDNTRREELDEAMQDYDEDHIDVNRKRLAEMWKNKWGEDQ